ncbi:predicted protein [Chaetoceros tenuissimus]|uniref:Uncharacterized protein n=1 Tax=Chaetoceros tenuissimus TaxID=426638 RepID=A0AAD3CK49_9STRA|nr:predicted protein [Chaetoceros tenuissimus]
MGTTQSITKRRQHSSISDHASIVSDESQYMNEIHVSRSPKIDVNSFMETNFMYSSSNKENDINFSYHPLKYKANVQLNVKDGLPDTPSRAATKSVDKNSVKCSSPFKEYANNHRKETPTSPREYKKRTIVDMDDGDEAIDDQLHDKKLKPTSASVDRGNQQGHFNTKRQYNESSCLHEESQPFAQRPKVDCSNIPQISEVGLLEHMWEDLQTHAMGLSRPLNMNVIGREFALSTKAALHKKYTEDATAINKKYVQLQIHAGGRMDQETVMKEQRLRLELRDLQFKYNLDLANVDRKYSV